MKIKNPKSPKNFHFQVFFGRENVGFKMKLVLYDRTT